MTPGRGMGGASGDGDLSEPKSADRLWSLNEDKKSGTDRELFVAFCVPLSPSKLSCE